MNDVTDPERQSGIAEPEDPDGLTVRERAVSRTLTRTTTESVFSDPERQSGIAPPEDPTSDEITRTVTRNVTRKSTRRPPRRREVPPHLRANLGPPCGREEYSGFVILRLSELLDLRRELDLQELIGDWIEPCCEQGGSGGKTDPTQLGCLIQRIRRASLRRLIQSITVEEILTLEGVAQGSSFPPLHSLAAYWRLDLRPLPGRIVEEIVGFLNDLPDIDLAYRELAATDPQGSYSEQQLYLDAAPNGIDARWAWAQPHGNGQKVTLIDLEQGWLPDHPDLPRWRKIYGDNRHGAGDYRGDHGAAVLGEVVAWKNDTGVVGIAGARPQERPPVGIVSHYHGAKSHSGQPADTAGHVADAVVAAIAGRVLQAKDLPKIQPLKVSPGDVLLIEVQRSYKPTEVDHADFDALRLASALGLIVVEAAGNGGFDLDAYEDETGARFLDRDGPAFRDSGALLVAAAESRLPHKRAWFSNYGSRADCYGWGEDVVTCGYGDLDEIDKAAVYTHTFSGTSSAAPVVAGAALIVQSLYRGESKDGPSLSPRQMRALLSNPATGTPQGGEVPGNIGVMPDLATIAATLGVTPEVYLRRSEDDDSAGSAAASTGMSPDILVRSLAGPGSEVEITVRARNRSSRPARGARATIYQAKLATLISPRDWEQIQTTRPQVVPGGGAASFSVTWKPPSEAPYGLLAVLHSEAKPPSLPAPPPYFHWQDFLAFNRRHASRTFVEVSAEVKRLEFEIAGSPDLPREFDFEVVQNRGADVVTELRVPRRLAAGLKEGLLIERPAVNSFRLPRLSRFFLGRVLLPAGGRYPSHLTVTGAGAGYSIAVCQLYRGEEVGRVTFQF